jgi:hypothetical protein
MNTNIARLIMILTLLLNSLFGLSQAWAEDAVHGNNAPANMLLYIQPVEYTNSINVMNYYSKAYWFEQGPLVEPLAVKQFNAAFSPVTMCEVGRSAKMIVWLQPRMFYNPQLQMFHGQITAHVYTGKGELKSSYVGKSKVHGFIDIKPEKWLNKSYEQAISKVVNKIKADKDLQDLMNKNDQSASLDGVSCGIVTSFPIPKVRALSF